MRCATRITLALLLTLASFAAFAGELVWTTAGPETGRVTVVRFDPLASNVVWAGTYGHGLYRSTDGGVTWSPMNNGLNTGIGALVIDPTNPAHMWTGQYNVWRSLDGGNHWIDSKEGLLPGASRITSMVVDPSHPSNLFVGTTKDYWNPSAGVQKSTNGGENWLDSGSRGLGTKDVFALAIDRLNPLTLFAGGLADPLNRPMFKSGDGGTTWFAISSGLLAESIDAIGIDPLNGDKVFAAQGGALMKSTDGGLSWALDGAGVPSSCCKAIVYERNSSANIWLATPDDIYRTVDGGVSWTGAKIGNERVAALDVNAEGTLVAGTESNGLFRRTAGATSWSAVNTGFRAADASVLAVDASNALYAGTQGTGIFKSIDHGQSWQRLSSDLLGISIRAITFDPRSSSIFYVASDRGFYKSTDAGASWSSSSDLPNGRAIAIDPSMTDVLYVATFRGVFKSTNGGASFTFVSRGLPGFGGISSLAIDPVNPMTLYAASPEFGVFKTTDGGANWTKRNVGLTNLYVNAIALDRLNPSTIFAATSGGIFKSTDGGESWSESSAGIPVKVVGALWIDPLDTRVIYTGTGQNGVFRSTDGGGTWSQLGGVSPAPGIWSIVTEPGGNVIHVGASGGVYSYEFPSGARVLPRRRTGR